MIYIISPISHFLEILDPSIPGQSILLPLPATVTVWAPFSLITIFGISYYSMTIPSESAKKSYFHPLSVLAKALRCM